MSHLTMDIVQLLPTNYSLSLSLVEEHGLIQHVNEPTRKHGNANNILDLVFTNRPGLIKKLNVVDGIADHNTVIIDVNISPKRKHRPKRNIFIRNKADHLNIHKSLDDFTHEYFSHEYFSLNQNTWLMKFNPTKCFTMTLASRKPTPNIYTFCGQQLKSVLSHCYLGVQIH